MQKSKCGGDDPVVEVLDRLEGKDADIDFKCQPLDLGPSYQRSSSTATVGATVNDGGGERR
jgi:hypothetical protein